MKYPDEFKKCLNCEVEDHSFRRGYCAKCYPLVLKIEKINKGILPDVLENIKKHFDFFEKSKEEYIRQIKYRLEIIKEARTIFDVSEHDLEYRINGTLRLLDGKSLGKINDPIRHYLKDPKARSFVYQLFTKIQLLKPFKIDYGRLYDVDRKN
ncbi:MAG: hypothetical protein WA060_03515 [Minisyncoccia bacterium]